jgi:hypothetical protein
MRSDLQARAAELLLLRATGGTLQESFEAFRVQELDVLDCLAIARVARGLGMRISLEDGIWLCSELRSARPAPVERLDLFHRLVENPMATVQLAHHLALNRETTGLTGYLRQLGIDPLSLALCCDNEADGKALLSRLRCDLPPGMQVPDWGRSSTDLTPVFEKVQISPHCLALVSPMGLCFYRCELPVEMPPLHAPHIRFFGGQGVRRLNSVHTESLSIEDQPSLERLPRPLLLEDLTIKNCPRVKLDGPLRVTQSLKLQNLPVLERWPKDLSVGTWITIQNCPRLVVPEQLALPPTAHLAHLPGLARLRGPLTVREEVVLECCACVDLPQHVLGRGTLILRMLPGLTSLPAAFTVEGNLVIEHCPIQALPKRMRVAGDLTLMHLDDLTHIPNDLEVGGQLRLVACRGLAGPAWSEGLPFPLMRGEADA